MKKTFLGFICGMIVALSLTALAKQMDVFNNSYKVMVNNQEANIEGYNMNGSTYFKLRDVGTATGFDVAFANDTISITTSKQQPPDRNGAGGEMNNMTLEEMKTKLAQDVASGKITQEQADSMLERFSSAPAQTSAPTE